MKILLSALLCLLLVSCNSTPDATAPESVTYQKNETSAPVIADTPKKTLCFDDLNNYTFVIETDEDIYRVAGDNMKGKSSQLHVSMAGYDVIMKLNTKGGSKLYTRSNATEEYASFDIEYSEIDFDPLREILYQVGVDFQGYYSGAKFTLQSETNDCYNYKMDYEGDIYDLTVDKKTGVWTNLACDGKVLMHVIEFSITKGIIPNH